MRIAKFLDVMPANVTPVRAVFAAECIAWGVDPGEA